MLNRICYFGCPKLDVKFKMPIQGCIVSKSFMFTSGTSTLLSQRKLRSLKWRNVDASTPDPWLPKPPQRLRPNQRQKLTRRQRERPRCALNIFFLENSVSPLKSEYCMNISLLIIKHQKNGVGIACHRPRRRRCLQRRRRARSHSLTVPNTMPRPRMGMLSKVYLVCIGIKSNLSRRLSAILVTAILVGFCTILYTNKTPHEGIH